MQSKESKKLINKSEVAATSYSEMEEIDNNKDEVMEKKKKSMCHVEFDESLNSMHIYSY